MNNVQKFMLDLGFNPALRGYHYLVNAIELCLQDTSRLTGMISQVYEVIAANYHTSYHNVERNIRNAIHIYVDHTRNMGRARLLNIRFLSAYDYPTNRQLISYLVAYIGAYRPQIDAP